VHTVDLPTVHSVDKASLALEDDVRAVREAIEAIDGPVVVVAHSYGGVPTTVAAAGQPNVQHLVYVAAFVLDVGESLLAAVGGTPPSWWDVEGVTVRAGTATEPAEGLFYGDVDPTVAASAVARLKSQAIRPFEDAVTAAAWQSIPSTFLITELDAIYPVPAQEALAARAGSAVVRLATSHSPFLSQPGATADVILGAGLATP
jgi:pimeloyl-ACP methyl ester carboxylesterase